MHRDPQAMASCHRHHPGEILSQTNSYCCNHTLTSNRVAARQTGGGFGGAVVCLCHRDDVPQLLNAVERDYTQRTGLKATTFVCKAGTGLEVNNNG